MLDKLESTFYNVSMDDVETNSNALEMVDKYSNKAIEPKPFPYVFIISTALIMAAVTLLPIVGDDDSLAWQNFAFLGVLLLSLATTVALKIRKDGSLMRWRSIPKPIMFSYYFFVCSFTILFTGLFFYIGNYEAFNKKPYEQILMFVFVFTLLTYAEIVYNVSHRKWKKNQNAKTGV